MSAKAASKFTKQSPDFHLTNAVTAIATPRRNEKYKIEPTGPFNVSFEPDGSEVSLSSGSTSRNTEPETVIASTPIKEPHDQEVMELSDIQETLLLQMESTQNGGGDGVTLALSWISFAFLRLRRVLSFSTHNFLNLVLIVYLCVMVHRLQGEITDLREIIEANGKAVSLPARTEVSSFNYGWICLNLMAAFYVYVWGVPTPQ